MPQKSVTASLDWYGGSIVSEINLATRGNLRKAINLFHRTLEKRLKRRPWGSVNAPQRVAAGKRPSLVWENDILVSGRKGKNKTFYKTISGRKAVRYSPPGTFPYKQTSNYANSIQKEFEYKGKKLQSGYVFTDVPYAPILEFGGWLQTDKTKPGKYSKYRLRNWGRRGKVISSRPAWQVVWYNTQVKMLMYFKNIKLRSIRKERIFEL